MEFKDQKEWFKKFAQIGIAAKGLVYVLVGGFTAVAAFSTSDGEIVGKRGAIQELLNVPFGQLILWIIAIGVAFYAIYRTVLAFHGYRKYDDIKKQAFEVGRYMFSAIIYGFLSYYIIDLLVGSGSSSGDGGSSRQFFISKILSWDGGRWLVGAIALGFLGKGIYQIYTGISEKFRRKVKEGEIDARLIKAYTRAGKVGYISRGIVLGVIAYLFFRAAIDYDASKAGGTENAFKFINSTVGPYIMGVIALGLVSYGIYMFFKARHREMSALG
jgi:hypothetical protein